MKLTRKVVAGAALSLALAGSTTAWATAGSPAPQPNPRSCTQVSPQAASTGTALAFTPGSSVTKDVVVEAFGSSTQVVIDVVGYYQPAAA